MKSKQLLKVFLAGFMMTLSGVLTGYAQDWVSIDPNSVTLKKGETKTVEVKFETGYTGTSVTWTYLGRTTVVNGTVDGNKITLEGVAEGETFVSCDVKGTKDSKEKTKSFMIDVNVSAPAATSITLPATASVKQGETLELKPTFYPTDASTNGLTWTSSDNAIATVSASGKVIGVKKGEATITVKTANDKSAQCKVTVTAPAPTDITLPATASVKQGETLELTPTLAPTGAESTITWTSSDETIAKVTGGVVTGVKVGKATIKAKVSDEIYAECEVTVTAPAPTGITIDAATASVKQGKTIELKPKFTPDDAESTLTWISSDEKVATVSASGVVKGVKEGTATITVKTANEKTATCTVTVTAPDPTAVILPETKEVKKGESVTLAPKYTPENATTTLTWKSSDETIATVADGDVTGVKEGKVTITVTTANGKSAECEVTVTAPAPTGISFDAATASVKQGKTLELKPTLDPTGAESTLTWSTSDEKVATVSASGVVKGVKVGTAKITVETANGQKATCDVTVTAPDPTAVSLPTTAKVKVGATLTLTPTYTPENATTTLTWDSESKEIATVSDGVVTGVKEGTAKITVKTANGKTAFCLVTVEPAEAAAPVDPTTITLPGVTQNVKQGETLDLKEKWTLDPTDASTVNLEWSTSAKEVATVADGVVTGVKASDTEVTISVKVKGSTEDAKTCTVKVLGPNPTRISLPTTKKVKVGEKVTLEPVMTPSDAYTEDFEWTSSKPEFATVSKGEVTGVKEGTATITVKTANELSSFCVVTVIPADPADPTTITLPTDAQEVKQGETLDLTKVWTLDPTDASTANLEWTSSDETIATVADGVVTGVKASDTEVTITVKIKGSDADLATCKVKVTDPDLASISLPTTAEVNKDATLDLKAQLTLTPDNAPEPTVTWSSAAEDIATVDATTGVVNGVKVGQAKITAKVSDEIFAECEVTVIAPVLTKIELPATLKMCVGEKKDLAYELDLTPDDAETPELIWESSNKDVVRVNANGVVIALNLGTAIILAQTSDGSLTATCEVTVSEEPDLSTLDNALYVNPLTVKKGETSFELPICLKDNVTAVGTSFTVKLPEGMTFATDEEGDIKAPTLNDARAKSDDFNVYVAGAEGTYNVSLMPKATTNVIADTDGKLLTFTVNVPDDVEICTYTVRLTSAMLTVKADDGTLSTLDLPNTSADLEVTVANPGDVNNDGKVDNTDAVMIIFASLGEDQEGYDSTSADVNNDGRVDLTDAIIVLYQSLGVDPLTPQSSRRKVAQASDANDALVIDNVVIEKGGTVELPVKFVNSIGDKIVGMQMNLVLPEGISTVKDEEELPVFVLNGTTCPKMSLYPTSNDGFGMLPTTLNASVKGSEGTLFTTTLCADSNLEAGSALEAQVTNAVFTVKDASGIHSVAVNDFSFGITVGDGDGADGIAGIAGAEKNGAARYSLSGQRVDSNFKGIVVTNGKKMLVK